MILAHLHRFRQIWRSGPVDPKRVGRLRVKRLRNKLSLPTGLPVTKLILKFIENLAFDKFEIKMSFP